MIWLWLKRETNLFDETLRLLHVAPELPLQALIRSLPNIRYVSTDIMPNSVQVLADLNASPWADGTFDVVMCNHVLEHIPDDRRAMAELFRVLRPGGWGLVLVPFSPDRSTNEDPTVTSPEDRVRLFGQEDHVRRYGREYVDRLWKAGFEVDYGIYAASLGAGGAAFYGIDEEEYLIAIRKPADTGKPAAAPTRLWSGERATADA